MSSQSSSVSKTQSVRRGVLMLLISFGGLAGSANPSLFVRAAAVFLMFTLATGCSIAQQRTDSTAIRGTRIDVDIVGTLYVVDADRNAVTLYSKDRTRIREIGGQGWDNDQFDHPAGSWARNGIDVFVADYGNHRIQRFDRSLNYVATLSTRDSDDPNERFGYPTDVALSRLGDLFICDSENTRIVKVNRFSKVERVFGGFDAGKGRLQKPTQVEIGPHDDVYVLDGNRIVVFDTFGNFLHHLGDGIFTSPHCVSADSDCIVVLDSTTVYCFDEADRLASSILLRSLPLSPRTQVQTLALGQTALYLLTSEGLHIAPRPCPDNGGANLDK